MLRAECGSVTVILRDRGTVPRSTRPVLPPQPGSVGSREFWQEPSCSRPAVAKRRLGETLLKQLDEQLPISRVLCWDYFPLLWKGTGGSLHQPSHAAPQNAPGKAWPGRATSHGLHQAMKIKRWVTSAWQKVPVFNLRAMSAPSHPRRGFPNTEGVTGVGGGFGVSPTKGAGCSAGC